MSVCAEILLADIAIACCVILLLHVIRNKHNCVRKWPCKSHQSIFRHTRVNQTKQQKCTAWAHAPKTRAMIAQVEWSNQDCKALTTLAIKAQAELPSRTAWAHAPEIRHLQAQAADSAELNDQKMASLPLASACSRAAAAARHWEAAMPSWLAKVVCLVLCPAALLPLAAFDSDSCWESLPVRQGNQLHSDQISTVKWIHIQIHIWFGHEPTFTKPRPNSASSLGYGKSWFPSRSDPSSSREAATATGPVRMEGVLTWNFIQQFIFEFYHDLNMRIYMWIHMRSQTWKNRYSWKNMYSWSQTHMNSCVIAVLHLCLDVSWYSEIKDIILIGTELQTLLQSHLFHCQLVCLAELQCQYLPHQPDHTLSPG